MNLLRALRRWLRIPEKPLAKPPRPTFMWEILNVITPSDKPLRRQNRRHPLEQLGDLRVKDVFN